MTVLGVEYQSERGQFAGPSILELLERELDRVNRMPWKSDKYRDGRLIGLASAVAIMRNPYSYLGVEPAPDFGTLVQAVLDASDERASHEDR